MSLNEKRLLEELKTKVPEVALKLEQQVGYALPLDIEWETFAGQGEYAFTRLRDSFFRELLEGIRLVTKDKIGKDAFAEKVKRVHIVCTDDPKKVNLELTADGSLAFVVQLGGGGTFSYRGQRQIEEYLEKAL